MPSGKKPEIENEEQSKRFIKTARLLGADETGKDFERALKILKSAPLPIEDKKRKKPKKRKTSKMR